MNAGDVAGVVFGIQRFCLDDGPGVRTTVFLKGCGLRCRWCHNPESLDPRPLLSWVEKRCLGCGACARICPEVHGLAGGRHAMNRAGCRACGRCAAACPGRALSLAGERIGAGRVMDTVLRDRRYYRDGGGLTVSGGEPTGQPEFLAALLGLARRAGIGTAVETNGAAPVERYRRLLPLVDVFLWDVKDTDPARHRENTGVDNAPLLATLRDVAAAGARLILRCPLVPGANDRPDHLAALGDLTESLPGVVGVQVMPYHRLAAGKAARHGLAEGESFTPPPEAETARWNDVLAARLAANKGVLS